MSLWGALERAAERFPERPFLTGSLGADQTRADLLNDARCLMTSLRKCGVSRGDRVVIMAPASAEVISLQWALAGIGVIQVPLNTSLHGPLLVNLLKEISPKLAASTGEYAETIAAALEQAGFDVPLLAISAPDGALPNCITWADAVASQPGRADPSPHHGPLVIIYTSGTTGPSKGVVLSNRWAIEYCRRANEALGITEDDTVYGFLPLFHIAGQYAQVDAAALMGARLALCPPFRSDRFWQDIERYGCTSTVLMSSMASVLRERRTPPGSLRKLHIVPLPPDFAEIGKRLNCRVTTNYGSTEASIAIANPTPVDSASCGFVAEGYEARIVDEWDEELPNGSIGELVLRTERPWTMMSEYWRRADATSRAWRNGWLHTGDLFTRREDGSFVFVDRAKDAIRRRGENISSAELEALICLNRHIREAAAVAMDLEEGDQEVCVYYVSEKVGGAFIEPEALMAELEAVVPRYMLPRYLKRVDDLPRTQTGKVRKADLRNAPASEFWDRRSSGMASAPGS